MKEQPKHVAAYEFYRDMPKRSLAKAAGAMGTSETSINKWNKAFDWQRKIATWDAAIREGIEERAITAVVDTRLKELEQLDRAFDEIDKLKPLIFSALEACTTKDPETGKRHIAIIPENTQDMTALYNAMSRLNSTQVKIVEVARKIRGESDKIDLTGSITHEVDADPDVLKTANELAQKLSRK